MAGRQVTSSLRRAGTDDVEFLWEMLSYASHSGLDPGALPEHPELARYVAGWGRPTDLGIVAADDASGERVGAAWLRLLTGDAKGYGYVDDATPELAIAVLPTHRGRGIGARLLTELLDAARATFDAVSLSVRADNAARRLYERLGFRTVGDSDAGATSVTMRIGLTPRTP
jgi:ribosomal protein S18 acetylase RimI-like enzyme